MPDVMRTLVAVAALTMIVGRSPAQEIAAGRTSWRSFRHDHGLTGVATSSLPADLELQWQVALGDQVLATAAIVGAHVYVPCLSGELVCLDRKTGTRVWAYRTLEVVPKNSFAPGFKSSPTVTDDAIYLGDEEGLFHAVDRASGKGRWKFATRGEIFSAAAVLDDRVIFGSYDGRLYCLHTRDGTLAWQLETRGRIHCAPAIQGQVAFIAGCDQSLRAIDISSGRQIFEMPLESPLIASPALKGDHLYVGTAAGSVIAVDWKKQNVDWRYANELNEQPFQSSASITERLVVIGGRDRLVHAIHRSNGAVAWTFPTRGKVDGSPAVVDDRVFIGSGDGNLYALSLADGRELWKFNLGKPVSSGPAIGEQVLVICSDSRDGKVWCFGEKVTR